MYAKIENGCPVYPPKNDGCVFNVDLCVPWLVSHGYTDMTPEQIASASAPIQNTIKRYSKYKLKLALQARGLWDVFKTALTEDEYETFLIIQDMASDDLNFQTILSKFESIPDYQTILSACEME